MTFSEKRKHKRFIVEGLDIQCKMMFAAEVGLLNISLGGVALTVDKKLNIGSEYTLNIDSEDGTIAIKGVIVWEKMAGLKENEHREMVPRYEVGMRFKSVFSDKGAELIDFIDSNIAEKQMKKRVRGLRVKVVEPEKAVITGYHKKYTVKMMSMSGMLIETDQELKVESKLKMEMIFSEDSQHADFVGRVAYCSLIPESSPHRFAVGIEFLEINDAGKSKLEEYIDLLRSL